MVYLVCNPNSKMKDINLKYIEYNYLEVEEIIRIMNLTSDQLNQLIEEKFIPEASYVINSEITISSS
jgi:ribosome-interacting GTPase 1